MKTMLYLIVALCVALAACDSKKPDATETGAEAEPATTEAAETTADEAAGEGAAAEGMVEVAKTGTKFDPPVEKAQIPPGAWICDMGTVEYASMEKGDGKCPVCGMMLKQHGEAPAAEEGAADGHGHDHGDGHDHDHGDHDHAH